MNNKIIILESQHEEFIKHTTLWHGDHDNTVNDSRYSDSDDQDDNSVCDVYVALQNFKEGKAAIENIVDALNETDDEWYASWLCYLDRRRVNNGR